MIENRWLVELAENNLYSNSSIFPGRFLDEWENAASWLGWLYGDINYWEDTHLYTQKEIKERVMRAVQAQEERRKKRIAEELLEEEFY